MRTHDGSAPCRLSSPARASGKSARQTGRRSEGDSSLPPTLRSIYFSLETKTKAAVRVPSLKPSERLTVEEGSADGFRLGHPQSNH